MSEFDKNATSVNNVHIYYDKSRNKYVLQLNMEYFLLTEQEVEGISSILNVPKGMGLSIG
jgi:hypothetical protein